MSMVNIWSKSPSILYRPDFYFSRKSPSPETLFLHLFVVSAYSSHFISETHPSFFNVTGFLQVTTKTLLLALSVIFQQPCPYSLCPIPERI